MGVTRGMMSSVRDDWETPQSLFNAIDDVFHFTLDACASERNHKVDRYFSKANDGLAQSWTGEVVWCNPPYGREIEKWAKKCADESSHAKVVLLCAARPDTKWFAEHVAPYAKVAFIKGRLKFERGGVALQSAPFPSMLALYGEEPNVWIVDREFETCMDGLRRLQVVDSEHHRET